MTLQDGLIFKGDRVMIPKGLRYETKEYMHSGYGAEKAY